MATITSAQSGNWSSTTTWVGGVVPVAADTAVAATGHVVALDVDVTVVKVTQAGTGKFTLGNGRTLTANVEANAGTFTSGGTVEVTATTSATITGAITGISTTTNTTAAVVVTGSGTLTINGNVTGSAGNATADTAVIYTNVACSIIVNGLVTSGSGLAKHAIMGGASATGSFTISNGTSTAIATVYGNGLHLLASATVNVTGNLTTPASSVNAPVNIYSTASPTVTITGNVTNSGGYRNWPIYMTGASPSITIFGTVQAGASGTDPNAIYLTGNTPTVSITGPINGATGICVYLTGSNPTLTVTGNITAGTTGHSIQMAGGSCSVTGNVAGGTGGGGIGIVHSGSSATISVTGVVSGGSGTGTFGVYASGTSSTVTIVGTATATSTLNHAIRSDATTNGVIFTGNLTDSGYGATAIWTRIIRMTGTTSGTTSYTNTVGYPIGGQVQRVSPDLTTGMPTAANVRFGTVFGAGGLLTGTLRVPPANAVASGVPVDNTVGTAALRPSDIAALVGAQIAAAVSSPQGP